MISLEKYIGDNWRSAMKLFPFQNREGAIFDMAFGYLKNCEIQSGKNSDVMGYRDLVSVNFYGSGKTRLGNSFVEELGKMGYVKFLEIWGKKKYVLTTDGSLGMEEEFNRITKAKTVSIDMQGEINYWEEFIGTENLKKFDILEGGKDGESIFLVIDEFPNLPKHRLEEGIENIRKFRKKLRKLGKKFYDKGNRLYVYMCGRSNVLAEIGEKHFVRISNSPHMVSFLPLEPLKKEHLKVIFDRKNKKLEDYVPMRVLNYIREKHEVLDIIVEKFGVVPRLLEFVVLTLNYYESLKDGDERQKLIGGEDKEKSITKDEILKLFDMVEEDIFNLGNSLFNLDQYIETRKKESMMLLSLCNFKVDITKKKKMLIGNKKLSKIVGLSFFSEVIDNGKTFLKLADTYRHKMIKYFRGKNEVAVGIGLDKYNFLYGAGSYLEFCVGHSIAARSQLQEGKLWKNMIKGLEELSDISDIPLRIDRILTIPKLTEGTSKKIAGENGFLWETLSGLESTLTLHPDQFVDILMFLKKFYPSQSFLLLPRALSKSSDLYLYYAQYSLLIGIPCKDYVKKHSIDCEIFDNELYKLLPGFVGKDAVEKCALLFCCSNGTYNNKLIKNENFKLTEGNWISEITFTNRKSKEVVEKVSCILLGEDGLKDLLTDENLKSVREYRDQNADEMRVDFLKRLDFGFGVPKDFSKSGDKNNESTKNGVERLAYKEFKVFSYIKAAEFSIRLKEGSELKGNSLLKFFFEKCGGNVSPNKQEKIVNGDSEPWNNYTIYNEELKKGFNSVDDLWVLESGSKLFFLNDDNKKVEERKRKEEKEERKRKEEKEERKRKEEEEERKRKLEENGEVQIYFKNGEENDHEDFCIEEDFEKCKEMKDVYKEILEKCYDEEEDYCFYEYKLGNVRDKVSIKFRNFRKKMAERRILWLLTKKQKNKLKGGSGISLFDLLVRKKDDDDGDDDDGDLVMIEKEIDDYSISGSFEFFSFENTIEEKEEKVPLILICEDRKLLVDRSRLERKSIFFKRMLEFPGKEQKSANEKGNIVIDTCSFLVLKSIVEMCYFDDFLIEDIFGTMNFQSLIELLNFCIMYFEVEFERIVVKKLRNYLIEEFSNQKELLELKLLEFGFFLLEEFPYKMLKKFEVFLSNIFKLKIEKITKLIDYSRFVQSLTHHVEDTKEEDDGKLLFSTIKNNSRRKRKRNSNNGGSKLFFGEPKKRRKLLV